jgi:hypothetical protein
MAQTVYDVEKQAYYAKTGTVVYKPYNPQKPGIVIETKGDTGVAKLVRYESRVKWVDGSITTELCMNLMDFEALIRDHEKKLATHKTSLVKLQLMTSSEEEK